MSEILTGPRCYVYVKFGLTFQARKYEHMTVGALSLTVQLLLIISSNITFEKFSLTIK